jgi:lipopolysaccharide export system permease protein
MKKYLPKTLIMYLSYEFLKCLLIIFCVFLSILLLTNFIEELIFFKEKQIENFFLNITILTIVKTINTLLESCIFIFLFSGIFFFVKFIKNNELNSIKLSGISNLLSILTPALLSFCIGVLIVFIITPISAGGIKFYEKYKSNYSQNDNLLVINDSGLWFMEKSKNDYKIIRADRIVDNDFSKFYNSTIYTLDKNFNFIKRYDSKLIFINKNKWILENTKVLAENSNENNKEERDYSLDSSININELKNLFTNANTFSFWEILKNIKKLNERGYSGDELKIKFHRYLSLPIYLFSMIILSTVFTINIKRNFSNFIYIFFGIVLGVIIYFLNDLSIALGISGKMPLTLSVWIPIFLILVISTINLIKINEK